MGSCKTFSRICEGGHEYFQCIWTGRDLFHLQRIFQPPAIIADISLNILNKGTYHHDDK